MTKVNDELRSRKSLFSRVMRAALVFAVFGASFGLADGNKKTIQVSNIGPFTSDTNTAGASFLTRSNKEIGLEGYVKNLEPMYAYTIWWVIFNRPNKCVDGCGGDEVGEAFDGGPNRAQVSLLWAGGFVADGHGQGHFSAHLEKNNPLGEVLVGDGLKRPRRAEVHFIIRCHGLMVPELAALQISTFNGACDDSNPCVDVGSGLHLP